MQTLQFNEFTMQREKATQDAAFLLPFLMHQVEAKVNICRICIEGVLRGGHKNVQSLFGRARARVIRVTCGALQEAYIKFY